MNESEIINVVREYLEDKKNSYALMMTGEWGSGKTHFVEHELTETLEVEEVKHPVIVASAYGVKDMAGLCEAIEVGFISNAIGQADSVEKDRKDSLVKFAKDTGISFLGKKIRDLEKKAGIDFKMTSLNTINLIFGPKALLVIDDVERCGMNLQELFGAIDHLVVNFRKKVLLICNEEALREQLDDNNKKIYDRLVEKTVWRKCQFEPEPDKVVRSVLEDELREIYPEAIEDVISTIRENGSVNFHSLNKMRPVLVGIKESGFFTEISDKESARKIFKEACGFAAMAAKGEHIEPPSDQEDSFQQVVYESCRPKYATLDFIPCFFERREGVDPKHVRNCLEDYLEAFYPDGPAARRALECTDKIKYILFRDKEIPELVEAICDGISPLDGSRGISFDIYPYVLQIVNCITKDFTDTLPEGITPLVEAMRLSIQQNPESAVRSVRKNQIEWQMLPCRSSNTFKNPPLKEIDDLRNYALETLRERKSESLNNVMENDPEQFAEKLYQVFVKPDDNDESVLILLLLDVTRFAAAMGKMSPEGIQIIRSMFSRCVLVGTHLYSPKSKGDTLSRWARKLKSEVDKLNPKEYYQRQYFNDISRSLDKLVCLSSSTTV